MSEKINLAKKVLSENIANTNNWGIFNCIDSSFFFPPRKILNQFLESGSDPCDQDRRMEDWSPFSLNKSEYNIVKNWWFLDRSGVVDDLEQTNWDDWIGELLDIDSSIDIDKEFKLGKRTINIMAAENLNREETLSVVNNLLPEIWLASSQAIEEGIKLISNEIPNMWVSLHQLLNSMFVVHSISIITEKNEAGYHVGLNPSLLLSEYPKILLSENNYKTLEDITVYITRDSEGSFTSELIDWS